MPILNIECFANGTRINGTRVNDDERFVNQTLPNIESVIRPITKKQGTVGIAYLYK